MKPKDKETALKKAKELEEEDKELESAEELEEEDEEFREERRKLDRELKKTVYKE